LDHAQLNHLLPGPVTLVFDRKSSLPQELNPNTKSIGIRIPNNRFMIELAKKCGEAIALTSANISNELSSLKIQVSLIIKRYLSKRIIKKKQSFF
jgi:tRNA A37 threonylcarbamoyladenosine synthetase subunit TsaC/SUA5/YrdC